MERVLTLAESLLDVGWERTWFGYDGPFPPYVRIGMKWLPGTLRFEPCFECWRKDRVLLRSKTSMRAHLGQFQAVRFRAPAVEDRYGAAVIAAGRFPVDEWLQIWRISFGGIDLLTNPWGLEEIDPLLLVTAGSVELRTRPSPNTLPSQLWEHFDRTEAEFQAGKGSYSQTANDSGSGGPSDR